MLHRPAWIAVLLGIGLLAGCAPSSGRAVTIICPWAVGGGTDRVSRIMADGLHKEYARPFVVVNKTGGSGAIGHRAGAQARPDGTTLTMITFELSTMHHMGISPLTYADFRPVIQINSDAAAIVVRRDAAWNSISDLLEHIKAHPSEIRMSGTATGGAWDLARAGMLDAAGLPVSSVVWVPNKGAAPSVVELLGGHLDVVCCSVPEVLTQVESGELRVLAVMAEERPHNLPDVPTLKESGVDWVAVGWRGLAVPKDTPDAIVDELAAKCQTVLESPAVQEQMGKFGFGVEIRVKQDFAEFLRIQDEVWKPVVAAAGYAKS